ncbi:MAG: 4'-phosphopantetheinyl transferase superfamily protein, partial [Acidobacteria bacterium]|nr:4'-phosphopantetheinyl transferase superfamily protein [Acidobacteriota bacterium]
YLNREPESICFSYNYYGKPSLPNEKFPIQFNVTHSRDLALIAVAREQQVGIDVEFVDRNFPVMKTAYRICSPKVFAELQTLKLDQQTAAFFQNWTLKESYLKAVGTGFSNLERHQLELDYPTVSDYSPWAFRFEDGRNWTFVNLSVRRNYKASMAVEGRVGSVRYRKWALGIAYVSQK